MPTQEVLNHRNMADEDTCKLCGAKDMWRHALLSCAMSRRIWALVPEEFVEKFIHCQEENPKAWLFALHEILDTDEFIRLIVTAWVIWGARRKVVYEDIYQSPFSTNNFVTSYLVEIRQASCRVQRPTIASAPRPSR